MDRHLLSQLTFILSVNMYIHCHRIYLVSQSLHATMNVLSVADAADTSNCWKGIAVAVQPFSLLADILFFYTDRIKMSTNDYNWTPRSMCLSMDTHICVTLCIQL